MLSIYLVSVLKSICVMTPNYTKYSRCSHTCRRGGATLYYENGINDKSIMWLVGRLQSIAMAGVYPEVTYKGA